MTDTGAYTDVLFGLFWLLGYRFSSRITDIGGARYWRLDPAADYGLLNGIARHRINATLLKKHWEDLLRLAGALKLGVGQATSIMRTLQIGDRLTKLAQAVAELERIDKTTTVSPTLMMKPNAAAPSRSSTKAKRSMPCGSFSSSPTMACSAANKKRPKQIKLAA